MRKQLFDTKIKDGIFLVGVIIIVIVASLSLDDVQGAFKTGKIKVTIYVPSYEVPSDGPVLKPGDAVKLYKKAIGRVLSVDFFVAEVRKPADEEPRPAPSASPAPGASPQASPAAAPSPAPPAATRPDIVSGLKVKAELYAAEFPEILTLVTPDSQVKVESQTLGDSSLQLMVSQVSQSVKDGDLIHFPKNHASLWKPGDPKSRLGRELSSAAEVAQVREELARYNTRPPEPEKKNPSEEF